MDYSDSNNDYFEEPEKSDLMLMTTAWKNEQASPDLLQYEEDLVESLRDRVQTVETLIDERYDLISEKCKDDEDPEYTSILKDVSESRFRLQLFQIEISRVKYILGTYLKCRLMKIQKYHRYISKAENNQLSLLSAAEKTFLESYGELVDKHLKQTFLKFLPDEGSEIRNPADENVKMITPFPDKYVFIYVNKDVGEFQLSSDNMEDTEDIKKGTISFVPYQAIKPLILKKFVELI
jgi:GINS complex subunit 4